MVNWTYIWTNYDETQPEVKDDLAFARYPQSTQGQESRPPYGGIGVGVSAYSEHVDEAMQAIECITSPDNQGVNAELTGNMPASAAGYEYPALAEIYPPELLALFQESLDAAAPRTVSPYWSDISGALLSSWHPSDAVDSSDPAGLAAVHRGRAARKEPAVSTVTATAAAKDERSRTSRSAATGRGPRTASASASWHPP